MTGAKVFRARRIYTMNPSQAIATHVAVRDHRILAVGTSTDFERWGISNVDDRFAGGYLMPGLVEAHCHLHEGALWSFAYVGFYDRRGPDGKIHHGLKNLKAVVDRLREVERSCSDSFSPLLAWGFDPVFFGTERLSSRELDQVSSTRPVAILHASLHLMNVNSAMLRLAGITREANIEGVKCDLAGEPTGELQEFAAMFPVNRVIGNAFSASLSEQHAWTFARIAANAGVTTITDLFNDGQVATVEALSNVTSDTEFPVRIVPAILKEAGDSVPSILERVRKASLHNSAKLRYGAIKIVVDGSIQGFTARLRWPGYHNGHDNGVWIVSPAELLEAIQLLHEGGVQLHIHTNGDEATEVALEALTVALNRFPRMDHRHTLHHCQMADRAQFRRMKALGTCVNLFANHIYFWGDVHLEQTMGPNRAECMDACGTALQLGVPFAVHSDAPVTPIGPIFSAWCAVNRMTSGGRVLGAAERLTVDHALEAITIGAAYTLHMDGEIGSVEVGKYADLCCLAEDPYVVPPDRLKDVRVLGTASGGQVHLAT